MRYIFFVLCFTLVVEGNAQKFKASGYQVEHGLPTNYTKGIFQDRNGYVWIGTDAGLVRFDGKNFNHYKNALQSNHIKAFYQRRNGQLLVVNDMGIAEIYTSADTAYFKGVLSASLQMTDTALFYPKSIYEDFYQNLWFGESTSVVKHNKNGFQRYWLGKETASSSFARSFSFVEDGYGNLYTVSQQGHLFLYKPGDDYFINTSIRIMGIVNDMFRVSEGVVWAAGNEGVRELVFGTDGSLISNRLIIQLNDVSCLNKDVYGDFYLGTWYLGLFKATWQQDGWGVNKIDDLASNVINRVFINENQDVWVSADDGIAYLQPKFFNKMNIPFERNSIQSVIQVGKTVFVTDGVSVYKIEHIGNEVVYKILMKPYGDDLYSLLFHGGYLWVGSEKGNLYKVDVETGKYTLVLKGLAGIFYLTADADGNIWICQSGKNQVIRLDSQLQMKRYGANEGILSQIPILKVDNKGKLICGGVGSNTYLYQYDKNKDVFENISPKFPFNVDTDFTINDFEFDFNGVLWLGSSYGLYRLQYDKITKVDLREVKDHKGIHNIKALSGNSEEGLWIGTDIGLIKYHKDKMVMFDKFSGMPNVSVIFRNLIVDSHLGVITGTLNGLAYSTLPHHIIPTKMPTIQSVLMNGKKVALFPEKDLRVFPFESNLKVDFISLTYPEDRVLYQYRILGLQNKWSKPTRDSQVSVPQLPYGHYRFEVRALQQQGVYFWSEPAFFEFYINRAWYQTWWAILGYILVSASMIWLIVKLYTLRLVKEKHWLEKTVNIRTAEIQSALTHLKEAQAQLVQSEKMASLGQLTAGVAHEINNPINFISANIKPLKRDFEEILDVLNQINNLDIPQETRKEIERIKDERELTFLIEETYQLLNGIEVGAKRTAEIVKGLRHFSRLDEADLKRANIHEGIDATITLLKNKWKNRIDIIKNYNAKPEIDCFSGQLNQVFMNVISNAIEAIPDNGIITISSYNLGESLVVSIKDTGTGIPEKVRPRIFEPFFTTKGVGKGTGMGLSICYGIIEKHNGKIEVESMEGQGTNVIITLPTVLKDEIVKQKTAKKKEIL
jgi:signal transduction histidine kinase/ligand-binding sensor domain-containing protein